MYYWPVEQVFVDPWGPWQAQKKRQKRETRKSRAHIERQEELAVGDIATLPDQQMIDEEDPEKQKKLEVEMQRRDANAINEKRPKWSTWKYALEKTKSLPLFTILHSVHFHHLHHHIQCPVNLCN